MRRLFEGGAYWSKYGMHDNVTSSKFTTTNRLRKLFSSGIVFIFALQMRGLVVKLSRHLTYTFTSAITCGHVAGHTAFRSREGPDKAGSPPYGPNILRPQGQNLTSCFNLQT